MATRMQQRRGTATEWTNADPILAPGEIGWETTTNKFKIGDGVNNWSDLPYFVDEDTLGGSIDDYVPLTAVGAANGVASLDAAGKVPSTQLDITELSQDAVNTALTAGTGISKTYNDEANTITIAVDTSTIATQNYVNTAVSNLVDSAPAALDTLNELAAALGDDSSFATTVTNAIAGKADSNHTHTVANITDLTATAAELNILDGATLTTTELNYVDGVTSSIQTQINGKIDKSKEVFHPFMMGL